MMQRAACLAVMKTGPRRGWGRAITREGAIQTAGWPLVSVIAIEVSERCCCAVVPSCQGRRQNGPLSLLHWISTTTGNARRKLRAFLITIPIVLIVMSMSACQGSAGPAGEQGPLGPVGPAGPTGEAATLGKDELQPEASVPPKWMPEAYTNYFVREAIRRYESDGLDSTVAHYNTMGSVDGQWYMFIVDQSGTMVAHANPALVGQPVDEILGPNDYPSGAAVAATADQDGAWFDYTFPNLATGTVETKHSWMVIHDGIMFGSGWYEEGPGKTDSSVYTQAFVQQAINLYDAVGLEDTVAYYNTEESVDGQWYVFMIDEDGTVIAHANPALVGQLASDVLGPNNYPTGAAVAGLRRRKRCLVRLHFHQPCHGLGGDQTFLDGNSRRHYLRVRLVRGRATEDRRPGLHGGRSAAGH